MPVRHGALSILVGAATTGLVAGAGSTGAGREAMTAMAHQTAIATGLARARAPQPGDSWRGCDDARAAGTAPIYVGEPGYRPGMDRDSDGVACEPYRGW